MYELPLAVEHACKQANGPRIAGRLQDFLKSAQRARSYLTVTTFSKPSWSWGLPPSRSVSGQKNT
jgi:hypothetical protein